MVSLYTFFTSSDDYFVTGAISRTSFYTESLLPHVLFNVTCSGNEATLSNCTYSYQLTIGSNCYSTEDAGVICQSTYCMLTP